MDINSNQVTELMSPSTNRTTHKNAWASCISKKNNKGQLNQSQIKECFEAVECNSSDYYLTVTLDSYFVRPQDKLPKCSNHIYTVYNKLRDGQFRK